MKRADFPEISALGLADLNWPVVLRLLRKTEKRGAIDTSKRVRHHISAVFGYGMAEAYAAPILGVGTS